MNISSTTIPMSKDGCTIICSWRSSYRSSFQTSQKTQLSLYHRSSMPDVNFSTFQLHQNFIRYLKSVADVNFHSVMTYQPQPFLSTQSVKCVEWFNTAPGASWNKFSNIERNHFMWNQSTYMNMQLPTFINGTLLAKDNNFLRRLWFYLKLLCTITKYN